jgi:hypothetical protein
VPLGVEFVIPGAVEVLQVVVGVFAAVDAVGAAVEVVVIAGGGVVEAGNQRRGTVDGPGSDVVTGGLSLKSGLLAKQGKPEVPDDGGDDGYGHRMWRDDVMESRHKSLSFSSLSRELTHE